MIEEHNASSGAVESSAQQPQAEEQPVQSELTAQDILAASTVQTELSAGNEATGKSRWYIVHTYSGFEQRVEATIKEMMRNAQDHGLIHEVVVPTEKVIELGKGGAKRTTTRKFYPGYIMLRMTMTDFSWHLVQSIPKVTGFVGGKNRPAPMSLTVHLILSFIVAFRAFLTEIQGYCFSTALRIEFPRTVSALS